MVKSKLIQPRLNPEVEIDEDNGETIRKMIIQNTTYAQIDPETGD